MCPKGHFHQGNWMYHYHQHILFSNYTYLGMLHHHCLKYKNCTLRQMQHRYSLKGGRWGGLPHHNFFGTIKTRACIFEKCTNKICVSCSWRCPGTSWWCSCNLFSVSLPNIWVSSSFNIVINRSKIKWTKERNKV